MNKHLEYLKYVLKHKYFVYQEGRKLGVSPLQLLVHDWQKFTPQEWFPYVETFYGDKEHPNLCDEFDRAWLHHQKLGGKHHWQYWVLLEDSGKETLIPIPDKYRREMLADWRGAGRAIHVRDETAEWYEHSKTGRKLHPETQEWVEKQLGIRR